MIKYEQIKYFLYLFYTKRLMMKTIFLIEIFFIGIWAGAVLLCVYRKTNLIKTIYLFSLRVFILFTNILGIIIISILIYTFTHLGYYSIIDKAPSEIEDSTYIIKKIDELEHELALSEKDIKDEKYHIEIMEQELQTLKEDLEEIQKYEKEELQKREKQEKEEKNLDIFLDFIEAIFVFILGLITPYLSKEFEDKIKSFKKKKKKKKKHKK